MTTNSKKYMNKYMNRRYHNDKAYQELCKTQSTIRIKALGVLCKKYPKEFRKIMVKLGYYNVRKGGKK
jgi:hypothetical protein